jgi:hypothetical protein
MSDMSDTSGWGDEDCPVTGRTDMIDDCHIEIQFGYGSDKDMWTYNFGPVHDVVGKAVLDVIQGFMDSANPPIDKSVDDFGEDTLAIGLRKQQEYLDTLTDEEITRQRKEWLEGKDPGRDNK